MRKSKQPITNIKQNEAQYNLDRQKAKIFALLSRRVGKYHFVTGEGVLLEKGLLGKAATIKRFKCSPLSSELKNENDIARKQCQGLYKVYKFEIKTLKL